MRRGRASTMLAQTGTSMAVLIARESPLRGALCHSHKYCARRSPTFASARVRVCLALRSIQVSPSGRKWVRWWNFDDSNCRHAGGESTIVSSVRDRYSTLAHTRRSTFAAK